MPALFDRLSEPAWSEAGGRRIDEVASERVRGILAEHEPEPISDSAGEELSRILEEAGKEMVPT